MGSLERKDCKDLAVEPFSVLGLLGNVVKGKFSCGDACLATHATVSQSDDRNEIRPYILSSLYAFCRNTQKNGTLSEVSVSS